MLFVGGFEHPEFGAALDRIRAKADERRVPCGVHVVAPSPEQMQLRINEGFRFLAYSTDADMAEILREKKIPVREEMLEDVRVDEGGFALLTAFELFEYLYDPETFLRQVRSLLKPGGYLYLTTLNGLGFDIQLLWNRSKSVSPPHHLNFLNPRSMNTLLHRVGFEVLEISTPGQLDWDIVEGGWRAGESDPGRFFRTVALHGSPAAKLALQEWLRENGLSSHMRAVARRPL